MPPLETRTESPGETLELPQDPFHSGEESSGYGTDSTQGLTPESTGEESREAFELLALGLAFPEATRAGP